MTSTPPSASLSPLWRIAQSRVGYLGVILGAVNGLLTRLALSNKLAGSNLFGVMTLGFLFVAPITVGYLTVRPARNPSFVTCIFAPWLTCVLVILGSFAAGLEGAICVVFATPVMLLLSSVGGVIAGTRAGRAQSSLPVALLLPWLVMGAESRTGLPAHLVTTSTSIVIDAPASVIWPLVVSVDTIRADERIPALFSSIGFPQPIAATLSHPGVGGVRTASFERGVVFKEAVVDWQPEKRIRFTIDATTVPPAALDEHVRIGGPYFDVLTGTYELRPISRSRTLLVLTSEHRVSTRFNFYASWWADHVMRSIQTNILDVIRTRAERAR